MLTAETRSQLYWNHARVVGEMADAYNVFYRYLFFNLEMEEQYRSSCMKCITYFTNIIRHIDVYLQDNQLTNTRYGFPLVPVPTYVPNQYELEQKDACHIENAVHEETREHEMQVIMDKDLHQNQTHSSAIPHSLGWGLPIKYYGFWSQ